MSDDTKLDAAVERCAQAIKLMPGGELRFVPDISSAAELALFLLALEKRCAELKAQAGIALVFYPRELEGLPAVLATEQPESANSAGLH